MSASFSESSEKSLVRASLKSAASILGRKPLTYLGMPESEALDVLELAPLLRNIICFDLAQDKLDNANINTAGLPLKERDFRRQDIWEFLRDDYLKYKLVADVAFLDFLGGGFKKDPFQLEFAGIRNYFARQAQIPNRAFIFAWTYMPRDLGPEAYLEPMSILLDDSEKTLLAGTNGIRLRSLAIRLLLKRSLVEHGMKVLPWQHFLYKRTMNTIILAFCKGSDPNIDPTISKRFTSPDALIDMPVYVFDAAHPVPQVRPLL